VTAVVSLFQLLVTLRFSHCYNYRMHYFGVVLHLGGAILIRFIGNY